MRAGVVILPEYRWAEAEPMWRRAEEYGFQHAWTWDHIGWTSFADRPWFGSVPTLTPAAYATSRIELGPLVASPNFRHPLPFARELTALDEVSGGRITVGIGAGTNHGYDAAVFGQNRSASRSQRLAEFEQALDAHGRRPEEIRRFLQTDGAPVYSLQSVECYQDFVGRAGELGFTDVVAPWPRREGIWSGSEDVLDAVATEVLPELSG